MVGVGGGERGVARTGKVWGLRGAGWGCPSSTEGASKAELAMVRAGIVGRASKKAAHAMET
jgi:hypothetical protein